MQVTNAQYKAMREVILTLRSHGIAYRKCTEFQIKVGKINYYPTTGKIQRDGEHAMKSRGLQAFVSELKSSGYIRFADPQAHQDEIKRKVAARILARLAISEDESSTEPAVHTENSSRPPWE